ncbi:type II secretion system protein, partial [bacterium]|nr:type II secretion system protein [Candidatus Elulimicrobium humile]
MKAKYKGFTLIEITLVMVLISILIAITTPLVSNVIARNDVGSAHEALYNALLRAQQLSKNQYKDSQWRVCLDNANKQYTITSGTCSDPTNAEIIKIASNITISSDQTLDILFKAISGELDNTANSITTTLTGGGASKSIIIDKKGILSKGSTPQSIPTIPTIPPLTVTSCTYADKKISIPYTEGRVGYTYSNQSINSTGVTGLTATLSAGDGPLATGGDTVTDIVVGVNTTYRVHTFTTVGTSSLNVIQGGEFEYLVVGGGGGGSRVNTFGGGGGGAGGLLTGTLSATPQAYTVTVGAGGAGRTSTDGEGTKGSNSVFGSITSTGGGGGVQSSQTSNTNGGSGGGG